MYNNKFTCLHYKTQQVLKSRWSYLVYHSKNDEMVELMCSHSYLMNNLSLATKNEADYQALSKTLAAHLSVIVWKILLSVLTPLSLQVQVGWCCMGGVQKWGWYLGGAKIIWLCSVGSCSFVVFCVWLCCCWRHTIPTHNQWTDCQNPSSLCCSWLWFASFYTCVAVAML